MGFTPDFRGQGQREIDPCRDATTRHAVAVKDSARLDGLGPKKRKLVMPSPMRRCLVAFEQPRRPEDERAGANACYPFGILANLPVVV